MSPQKIGFRRAGEVSSVRRGGWCAWTRFQIGWRRRQCGVEVHKGDFADRNDPVRAFDGCDRKSSDRGRCQSAERAAAVAGDLAGRILLARAAIRHVAGADDFIRRQRGHCHVAGGQAIGETLQQEKQNRQRGDGARRTPVLHDPANESHAIAMSYSRRNVTATQ
ncbi:hypothetical protein F3P66_04275 [Agrobacterium fabrum]|uniref:Uncharacterized protein n=1 Tax=Agrobacterium fabrum (strain C58 / ATCC 33970) TaxID=176299 RepID=Q8UDX2_AGRFC|nr:hypothetical protein Atu1996 [Agrobacterium fabrum str. C58]QRM58737.1 hypothetical protein F3P66_04275 [Agrobacterium fabrum]TRB25443.1 hypothetical protein EXN51_23885 [Agrobacterium fabrum]